jgi:predicted Ser/Thr protein kinase
MNTLILCQHCGKPLTAHAVHGLCPECLLKAGLGSGTAAVPEDNPPPQSKGPRFIPPTPEQLSPRFPQLEIQGLLGQGGMGAVYKARQHQLDRWVALKILPAEVGRDPAFSERFTREARALARLNHPNIVAVHDFGQANGFYYFLMEFVEGVTLRQLIAGGGLSPREALAIVPQICEALQYAHDQGIVHRDIKPENILVEKSGRVKIADFGLAMLAGREPQSPRLTQPREVMGTPNYMAPEQIEKPRSVDHRADIYSLGVVFYELLTGELPLGRFPVPSKKVQVDVRLDQVVLRALEKEPELRYQQASEVKTDIEAVAGTAAKVPSPSKAVGWNYEYRSHKTLFGLPLLHITSGRDLKTGKPRVATGIIAIGAIAKGVVALGGVAFGGLAFGGGLSIGLLAVGGGAVGLVALGGAALALLLAFGGAAVAPVAFGGGAVGWFAMGGGAWGVHAIGGNAEDEVARGFFGAWAGNWWTWAPFILLGAPMLIPFVAGILTLSLKGATFVGPKTALKKMRWSLFATGLLMGALWLFTMAFGPRKNAWEALLKRRLAGSPPSSNQSQSAPQTLAEVDWQKLKQAGGLLGGTPLKMDDRTVLKIENTNDAPLQLTLFKIDKPPIQSATYAVSGEIKYENVRGSGYLEMWNYFPPLAPGLPEGQCFSRTL